MDLAPVSPPPIAEPSSASRPGSVQRVVTLAPGEYWRSTIALEFFRSPDRDANWDGLRPAADGKEAVPPGTLLLLRSVLIVDDAAHTVVLHPHPLLWPNGSASRMLVEDFLLAFVHVDQAAARAERLAEMRGIQVAADKMTEELSQVRSDPARFAEAMQEGLRLLDIEAARRTRGTAPSASTELVLTDAPLVPPSREHLTAAGVISLLAADPAQRLVAQRTQITQQLRAAEGVTLWLSSKTAGIEAQLARLRPFHQEVASAMVATTETAVAVCQKIHRGLATVGIYCGEGVEVEAICRGESAAPDVPLHLFQARVYCDEELSVFAEVDATFDWRNRDEFDGALRDLPTFRAQVFGSRERCVLLAAVSRRDRPYDYDRRDQEENKATFLLVRDGENIFRVKSAVASHREGDTDRLFPTLSQLQKVFTGCDGREIPVEDLGFSDRRDSFDTLRLHFLRFLYLICGLDHRERLLGRFYPAELHGTTAFLAAEFQERYFRFIFDADDTTQLPDGRPALADWLRAQNQLLQSGSRVLCHWDTAMTPSTAPGVVRTERGSSRLEWRYKPDRAAEVAIAYRDGRTMRVQCAVSGERGWRSGRRDERRFLATVDLTSSLTRRNDFAGFLCLDAAKAHELESYVFDRRARRHHIAYLRLFKQGIAFLREEEQAEMVVRERLCADLVAAQLVAGEAAARSLVDEAVIAWRAARRGAALPPADMSSPSDWKSLHTLLWTLARRSSESAALITAAESIAAAQARQPLRLVSTGGSGGLALYCAPNSAERLDDLEPESSVIRLRLHRRHRKPIGVESEGWSTLLEHNAREVVLHEWPAAKSWAVEFPPALSRDTRATATQICRGFLGGCAKTLRPMDSSFAWEDVFDRYKRLVSDARGGYVQIPVMFLPFACGYSARRHSKESVVPWFLGVSISAAAWLRFAAPTREQAEEARAWTIGRYRNTQHAEVEHGDLELLRSFRVARHWPSSARPESMVMGGAMWRITALESALSAADVHTSMLAGFARAGEGERLVWMPPELADPATALPALEAALAPLLAHLRASAALLPPPPLGRRDRAEFARGVRRRAIVFLPMTLPASDSTPTASPAHAPADWERFNELRGALRRRHAEIEEAAHLVLQDLRALEFAKSLAPGRFVRLRSVVGPGPAAGGTARVLSVRPDAEVGVLVEVRAWDAAADAPIMLVRPAQLVLA